MEDVIWGQQEGAYVTVRGEKGARQSRKKDFK